MLVSSNHYHQQALLELDKVASQLGLALLTLNKVILQLGLRGRDRFYKKDDHYEISLSQRMLDQKLNSPKEVISGKKYQRTIKFLVSLKNVDHCVK